MPVNLLGNWLISTRWSIHLQAIHTPPVWLKALWSQIRRMEGQDKHAKLASLTESAT